MASLTLAEASKLGLNDLAAGVIENIVTVNPIYQVLPFDMITGNALGYNRENALGDVQLGGVDTAITAKAAATYTAKTASLTTILGDAEVNGMLIAQNVGGNAGNNPVSLQIASKAKSVGRKYQDLMVNGDSAVANEFDGLIKLLSAGQTIDAGAAALSFSMLDEVLDAVTAKNGQVDFLMMHAKGIRKVNALLRALGGTTAEYVEMGGQRVLFYNGVPIFRNDYIPTNGNVNGGSNESYVFGGCFDDGSRSVGIAGLTSEMNAGIHVEAVGPKEAADTSIWRVKFYNSFVNFSDLALAGIKEVTF
jgi:hypothetical protein